VPGDGTEERIEMEMNGAIHEGRAAYVLGSSADANPYRKATAGGYSQYQMCGIEHGSADMDYRWANLIDLGCQWDSGYAVAKREALGR